MMAAQRYPELFDGVVAGAPAMRPVFARLGVAHAEVAFNQAAPRDAAGRPIVSQIFSASDRALIAKALLDQCDALDGIGDGVIHDIKACRFDPSRVQCRSEKAEGCLSVAQAKAMKDAFEGPRDSSGELLYPGFPYDTGITETGPVIPGFLPTGEPGPCGPPNQVLTFDIDKTAWSVRRDADQGLTDNRPLDQPQHVSGSWQQDHFLPRCQRPLVLRLGHARLLGARGEGQRAGVADLEPLVHGGRHGPLQRRIKHL